MSLSPQVCKKSYKVHIPSLGEECEFWLVRVTDEQSITNPDKDHAYYTDDGKLFIYDGKNLVRVNCDICFTQEEREKLEDIEEGANKYILPVANDSSLGGIKTGFTQTEKQYAVEVTEEGQAYVTVPWTDTVYTLPVADTDTLGGVKLGYSQNGKNYPVLKDSEGNIYVAVPWVEYQLQQASAETLGGIKDMRGLPDIIFIVDQKKEDIAIKEANKLNIPVICLADTNADPDGINYIIPGNDDAIRSIKLITSKLADAVLEGKQLREANANTKKVEEIKPEDAGVSSEEVKASKEEEKTETVAE